MGDEVNKCCQRSHRKIFKKEDNISLIVYDVILFQMCIMVFK